jgi:hypothetical protein
MGNPPPPSPTTPPRRFDLSQLPLAARLVLAAFLISVGIGYSAALVQLHFQHAQPGSLLPTAADARHIFSFAQGEKPKSKIEVLLDAPEDLPFNGTNQMSGAFTRHSLKWTKAVKERAREKFRERRDPNDEELAKAEAELRKERETERLAVLAWVRAGASKADYKKDEFCPPDELAKQVIDPEFVTKDGDKVNFKIRSILQTRCVRCHDPKGGDDSRAMDFPLDTYEALKPYVEVKATSSTMSIEKLAQTTHVHLLGFSMLYLLTGLLFAFTKWPGIIRGVIAPLALVAQVADISCWWLARIDPMYADVIPITGAIVGGALAVQLLGTLVGLFWWKRGVLLLLVLAVVGGWGGYEIKTRYVDPQLAAEKAAATATE